MAEASTSEQQLQTALIHSLITLNISDQWTRTKVQNDKIQRVIGALLGKQSGRNVEFLNTFEVKVDLDLNGMMQIDEEYFMARDLLFKETFPTQEFLGFYITGPHLETNEQDVLIQMLALKYNEASYLLKFNAETPVIADKLSISVFESIVDPSTEKLIFHPIPIKIVSELSEQIGLDHVAKFSTTGNTHESSVSRYLASQFGALDMLMRGVETAHNYIQALNNGKIERDEALLKEIYKLCQKLSAIKPDKLLEKELKQISNQKLMVYLTALTNVQASMFNLITKLNLVSNDRAIAGHNSLNAFKKHF